MSRPESAVAARGAWTLAVFAVLAFVYLERVAVIEYWDEYVYITGSWTLAMRWQNGEYAELLDALVRLHKSPILFALDALALREPFAMQELWKFSLVPTLLTCGFVSAAFGMLMRLGVRPLAVLLAAVAPAFSPVLRQYVGSAFPDVFSGALIACTLLLIPWEQAFPAPSPRAQRLRGAGWGLLFGVGALVKVTHLYFAAIALAGVCVLRWRRAGAASLLRSLLVASLVALPAVALWAVSGTLYLEHARHALVERGYAGEAGLAALLETLARLAAALSWGVIPLLALLGFAVWRARAVRPTWPELAGLLAVLGFAGIWVQSRHPEVRFVIPIVMVLPIAAAVATGIRPEAGFPRAAWLPVALGAALLLLAFPVSRSAHLPHLEPNARLLGVLEQHGVSRMLSVTSTLHYNALSLGMARRIHMGACCEIGNDLVELGAQASRQDYLDEVRRWDAVVFEVDGRGPVPNLLDAGVAQYLYDAVSRERKRLAHDLPGVEIFVRDDGGLQS